MQSIKQLVEAIYDRFCDLDGVRGRGPETLEFEERTRELCCEVERRAKSNSLSRKSAQRVMGIFFQMVDGFIRWCPDDLA